MNVLEVSNLRKHFGGIKAVNGLSFSVAGGEIVSIIGPNGAGKTTAFNLITGLYRPDEGTVTFFGRDITRLKPHHRPLLGIGRTFQNLRLFRSLTVLENVLSAASSREGYGFFPGIFRSRGYTAVSERTEEYSRSLLDFFGLGEKASLTAGNLPYGEQRKLELARALALKPKLLLVDEPGAGMNPTEVQEFIGTIRTVREKFSVTIVIIEHQMELVMNLSDRIVVMDFGEKIMEGLPAQVRSDDRVIEAYLGERYKV